MRILNVAFGFLLAIGVAYLHDAMTPTPVEGRPQTIVNWDVFGHAVRDSGTWLGDQFDRLRDRLGWRD